MLRVVQGGPHLQPLLFRVLIFYATQNSCWWYSMIFIGITDLKKSVHSSFVKFDSALDRITLFQKSLHFQVPTVATTGFKHDSLKSQFAHTNVLEPLVPSLHLHHYSCKLNWSARPILSRKKSVLILFYSTKNQIWHNNHINKMGVWVVDQYLYYIIKIIKFIK